MKKYTPLRIVPLGGLGEVGKNMMVYEYGEELLIVDAGIMFPENDMLGIDYIIPDINYLLNKKEQVKGIIITHGHEDHIGAIHHLLDDVQAPIYATPLTRGLIEAKLARNGAIKKTELITVQAGESVHIGPFWVEMFHVCHSIPDSVGLGIHTPAGLIVHTGDFKFDQTPVDNWPTDFAKLAEFSQQGVLALLSDSTNAERPGWTPSEKVIDPALEDIFRKAPGRIIVASFASLISRMQQVGNAAVKHGRKMAFAGTSMVDNAKIARKLGYLDLPEEVIINLDQALKLPESEVVLMCTGSQGEPSSIMGRLSTGKHHRFDVHEGDTIILSSHPIPGNEEMVYRIINRFFQHGADVIYETIAPVHVSGHASKEELKLMINLVKPEYFIPIHGEIRHLKQHARIAEQMGISSENIAVVENGQVIEFSHGQMRLGERVPGSHVFVDGSGVGDVGFDVMREREALSQGGILLVNLLLDKESHHLLDIPEIKSHGFKLGQLEEMNQLVMDTVERSNGNMEKSVIKAVRNFVYGETHRRPLIFVNISEV